jgi:hypothetical protein
LIFKDTKIGAKYACHSDLKELIGFKTTVDLTQDEIDLFGYVTGLIAEHPDFKKLRKRSVAIIFSDKETVSMTFPEGTIGSQGSHIMMNYSKWTKLDEPRKIICLVEEFVHHFWDTADEIEVSKNVSGFFDWLDYDRTNGNYIFFGKGS